MNRADPRRRLAERVGTGLMTWEEFKGGYLRLALGWCQMGFSATAMVALILFGLAETTIALAVMSMLATAISRWLYSGRSSSGTAPPTRNDSKP